MAVGNPLMGTWRKKLGDVVFYRRKGEQVARARNRKPANPQTRPQLIQRSRLKPVVAMFRVLDGVAHGVLRVGETQYNNFIKQNLREARPEMLDVNTPAVYPGVYPKLIPPMPRIGLGYGLPILAPYVVTVGRFPMPAYGLAAFSQPFPEIGTNTMSQQTGTPFFRFPRTFFASAIEYLTNLGVDVSAPSGTVALTPFVSERLINFMVSGYDNIHSGFLIAYYAANELVVDRAIYDELGDIVDGSISITWSTTGSNKNITSITGSITNSVGRSFNVAIADTNSFAITLPNSGILPNGGNASSIILSRRSGGSLEVSTSRMLLCQGATQAAYLSAFDPEVEEAAILDYTKTQSENDGLNLGIVE